MELALWFTPDAIREHYDSDLDDLTGLTDEDLKKVGEYALCDDSLYRAFHEALESALEAVREGLTP